MRPIGSGTALMIKRNVAKLPGTVCKAWSTGRAASPKKLTSEGPVSGVQKNYSISEIVTDSFVEATKCTALCFVASVVSTINLIHFYIAPTCRYIQYLLTLSLRTFILQLPMAVRIAFTGDTHILYTDWSPAFLTLGCGFIIIFILDCGRLRTYDHVDID